jgi:heavy metal sensor kinase
MFSKVSEYLSRLDVKLTLYYTLIIIVLMAAFTGFFIYRLERSLLKQVDKILGDEGNELAQQIRKVADITAGSRIYEQHVANRKYFPIIFRVVTGSGEVAYASRGLENISLPSLKGETKNFYTVNTALSNYALRIYEKKIFSDNAGDFTIQIVTETKEPAELLQNLSESIMPALCIILFLSVICGMVASRKPRKIISNVTSVTQRISSQNLSERLSVPAAHDEIYDLTTTINNMLDRLQNSFKEIKQFTADVSHELRNPLFSIKGEMEVALSQERTHQAYREVIQECLERINSLSKMVNDLFLISRFELKKVDLDMLYLDFSEIVQDLHGFFLPMAQEKKLSFTIDRCDRVLINGDKTRILQLLNNLIDNAIKFTPEDGSVALSLIADTAAVRFSVRDTGIGIPEGEIPYIFDRLYQVDKSRSGSSRGTGLGLHICRKIVEVHGGSIEVTNNEDKGATFTVILPKA